MLKQEFNIWISLEKQKQNHILITSDLPLKLESIYVS